MTSPVKAVEISENKKTGLVSATYASQNSCPDDCPFYRNGCYAEFGPTGIHTRKISSSHIVSSIEIAKAEAEAIRGLSGRFDLRVHVVGDCADDDSANIVSTAMAEHKAKHDCEAWTYTHAWRDVSSRSWNNQNVLASVESIADIKKARRREYAAAIVVAKFKSDKLYIEDGEKLLPCPNQTRGVQCVDCRLCMKTEHLRNNDISIAFEAHGAGEKKVRLALETV